MRQVPAFSSFLIIGNGRLARHLRTYLDFLHLPFVTWNRSEPESALTSAVCRASHILLAISDSALDDFFDSHPGIHAKTCVHFSGTHVSAKIPGAHPLMTFSERLYDFERYARIPFILEKEGPEFHELLPGFKNPNFKIDRAQKPLYHALCVLSGNFTVLLWEKAFADFALRLDLPKEALLPYLSATTENLVLSPEGTSVLTGPLARNDRATIARHLKTLEKDPFGDVYRSFVAAHDAMKTQIKNINIGTNQLEDQQPEEWL